MKGQSLLLLGAGIVFGTTGVQAQHPEGGHPEGQHAEAPRSQGRIDTPGLGLADLRGLVLGLRG